MDIIIKVILLFDNKIPEWISAIAAFIAVIYGIKEYKHHKKEEKIQLLLKYNERYMTDPTIKKVVSYIIKTETFKLSETKNSQELPSLHEKELFMRFFEELYILIEDGQLPKDKVYYLFSYYLLAFHRNANLRSDVEDYPKDEKSEEWKYYFKMVKMMEKYDNKSIIS